MRATTALAIAALLSVATPALAKSSIYTGLTFGYGSLSGSKLIVHEVGRDIPSTDPATCCPSPGIAAEFRLGFAIEGLVAPEFAFIAHGFDLSTGAGGEGFIGGGLRIFPVGLLGLAMDTKGFPIDLSIGAAFGYTVVGKDFAYSGSFVAIDLTAEYIVNEVFSIGARFTAIPTSLSGFAWTDYDGNLGRCLESDGTQNPNTPIQSKDSAVCAGSGPSSMYISPQLSATFHFDVID